MTAPFAWRLATPADDAPLLQLWAALNAEDVADAPPPLAHMQRSLAMLRQQPQRGRFVVLEVAAQVVGYALLVAFWSTEQGGEVCVIDELYVCPPQRGQGHAARLLADLQAGCVPPSVWPVRPAALELEVSPTNRAAQRLYLRLGFAPVRNALLRWSAVEALSPSCAPPPA